MILSAGLTPAWQQILTFDSFRYGEVNRAGEAHWCASGKVFNAGIAAQHLSGSGLTLATVGGPPVPQIEAEFRELGVAWRWVRTESTTRVCTTMLDRATGTMTELVENGRAVTEAELAQFLDAYAEEVVRADIAVVIGSLPAGTPQSYYRDLLQRTSCPAVLDFRGDGLLGVLDLKPLVVKPNREELSMTVDHSIDTDEQLVAGMRSLNDRGAQWVVITQGPGPVWVSSADSLHRLHPPHIEDVVNPIGCGDAMTATIAWAVEEGHDVVDAVRLGIAASCENLRQLLPCRLDPERVRERAREVRVETL